MRIINWKATVWAGLITGLVFLILEMIMVPLFLNGSPWAPVRMMAAILLGQDVAPPPASFDFKVFMAAMVVHFPGSILLMIIGAVIIDKLSFNMGLIVGAILGLLLYWIGFYLMTDIWPWFAKAHNWVSLVNHIIYGLVGAWAYFKIRDRYTLKREL